MSSLSQFVGGGRTFQVIRQVIASETFTATKTGCHRFHLVGGGGGGGSANDANAGTRRAVGGQAGGYMRKDVFMTVGQTAVITIGAGGAGVGGTGNGSNGTDSTIVVGGVTYTAQRGAGGGGSITTDQPASNSLGGATNGDINAVGGPGAACAAGSYSNGGAVSILGTRVTTTGCIDIPVAPGDRNSPWATAPTYPGPFSGLTGLAGAGASGYAANQSGSNGQPGGVGGAVSMVGPNGYTGGAGHGGIFAAVGTAVSGGVGSHVVTAGTGGYGGGGGSAVAYSTGGGSCSSGAGGPGVAFIEW